MERSVRPVMPCVLEHKEDSDLICHCEERWEGYASGEATELGHRMEEPGEVSLLIRERRIQAAWAYQI